MVIFSFLGFIEATALAGETENPQRAVPLAIIGSVLISITVYLVLQIAFIGALPPGALLHGWTNLHFSGDMGPFAGLAVSLGIPLIAYLVYADSIISPIGTGIAYTTTTARINYGMSVNQLAPKIMQHLNADGVPVIAILCNAIIGIVLLFPFPAWEALVKFQSAAIVVAYSTGSVALVAMREQVPQKARPFKLPYHRSISFLSFTICNLIIYWSGWHCIWRLMISVLLGIIVFITCRSQDEAHRQPLHLQQGLWLMWQMIGLSVIAFLGDFGGIGVLPLGWDFPCVALLSLLIMAQAHRSRLSAEETAQLISYAESTD